ncbi:MAG TPA: glycosyltransferase [Pyrinomonadaceae bacterium]|nr:glycosyltransferase [Pyrinomonadaceae bacterium]
MLVTLPLRKKNLVKPRILQLIDSFDEGGSERQALQLTRLLAQSGRYHVSVACLKADGVLRSQISDLEVGAVASYPLTSFYDANAVSQLRLFARDLRRLKIEVLHTHDFYTNIFGMAAGRLAGVPIRIASRRETSGMRTLLQQRAQRAAYCLAHQILANSAAVREKLITEGIDENRITVIHNGFEATRVLNAHSAFDALRFKESVDQASRFVTIVANMRHEVKDYPMFLRSALRISKRVPHVKFLLAGEGELRESLEQTAVELGIEQNTIFLGRVQDIAALLNISDVCVLSSRAEGFSNSILEYMAAARPVVVTDVGGAREAVIEGKTGYLVQSGDDETMAERIISLLNNPRLAEQFGKAGAKVIGEKFSTAAQLEKTEALYEGLLRKHKGVDRGAKDTSVEELAARPMVTRLDLR